jgi:hypothetical protein
MDLQRREATGESERRTREGEDSFDKTFARGAIFAHFLVKERRRPGVNVDFNFVFDFADSSVVSASASGLGEVQSRIDEVGQGCQGGAMGVVLGGGAGGTSSILVGDLSGARK